MRLDHRDLEAFGVEQLAFVRGAQAARSDEVAVIDAANHAAHVGAIIEGMQLELVGDILADLDAAYAVALRIQRRRIDANADLGMTAKMPPDTPLLAGMPTS